MVQQFTGFWRWILLASIIGFFIGLWASSVYEDITLTWRETDGDATTELVAQFRSDSFKPELTTIGLPTPKRLPPHVEGISEGSNVHRSGDFETALGAYDSGDFETALMKWRPLAEKGNAQAQNNLGVMYANGEGVVQDRTEAVKWYRRAAEQGDADAQLNLGVMYANGEGVAQNYQIAHMWLNVASANGAEKAREGREVIERYLLPHLLPGEINKIQRLAQKCIDSSYTDC